MPPWPAIAIENPLGVDGNLSAVVMFCAMCQGLLRELEAGATQGTREYTLRDILEGLNTNCYICFALHVTIAESFTGAGTVCFLYMTWSLSSADSQNDADTRDIVINAGYRLQADPEDYETWVNCFFQLKPPDSEDVTPYQPPDHTSDPALARLVRSWLQICSHTHTNCSLDQEPTYRPPRLMHIAPGGLKLVDGGQCPVESGWITLSHCWGRNPNFLRLTASNLSKLQDRILMSDLPQTFRDAVVLCERIGAEFLWIDSLCILQEGVGSKEDWLLHTKAMRAIYRNARLNISAEWAESSSVGLYKGRHPARVKRPAITFRAGPLEGLWTLTWDTESSPSSYDTPLHKRGWVVQERMLSPRIVHFCSDFIRWHCREPPFHKSERYPEGTRSSEGRPKFLHLPYPSVASTQTLLTNEAYRSFVDMAHLYSHTALTYPDLDKFPAFAGLAEHYSCLFKDKYIAGFLKGHLPRALAWTRDIYGTPDDMYLSRPSIYRAPSWSWASLDCKTFASPLITSSSKADVQNILDLCHVIGHCIGPCDPVNPYGQLAYASLTLRAHLGFCTWDAETASLKEKIQLPDFPSVKEAYVTFDSIVDFHMVQDRTRFMAIGAGPSGLNLFGLLLKGIEGSHVPTYERIGLFAMTNPSEIAPFMKTLQSEPLEEIVLV